MCVYVYVCTRGRTHFWVHSCVFCPLCPDVQEWLHVVMLPVLQTVWGQRRGGDARVSGDGGQKERRRRGKGMSIVLDVYVKQNEKLWATLVAPHAHVYLDYRHTICCIFVFFLSLPLCLKNNKKHCLGWKQNVNEGGISYPPKYQEASVFCFLTWSYLVQFSSC